MRLVFAGTPDFAATILTTLVSRGHSITLVLTQPDRPSGRGLRSVASAVKQAAQGAGLAVRQPATLKDAGLQSELAAVPADAWIVAAYGLILPKAILEAPPYGCINVHASLLPRWRGAAPIQRAIMAGDAETGVSIMRMDEGLDTGPVYLNRVVAIGAEENAGSLHDRLAIAGADALCEVLEALARDAIAPVPQPADGACYAPKLTRADTEIDWTASAQDIARRVRALDPTPGAATMLGGHALKIWRAVAGASSAPAAPGEVLETGDRGLIVRCGQGALAIVELQRAGARRMPITEFLRGVKVPAGTRLGR